MRSPGSIWTAVVPPRVARRFQVVLAVAGLGCVAEQLAIGADIAGAMPYPRWEWLPAVAPGTLTGLSVAGVVPAILLMAGRFPRTAASALAAAIAGPMVYDPRLFANHAWLAVLLLAYAGQLRAVPGGATYWPLGLAKVQTSIVYGFAGLTKMNADFLSGGSLFVLSGPRLGLDAGTLAEPWAPPLFQLLAVATVATELFLAVGLWLPRWRTAAVAVGVAFHLTLTAMMPVSVHGFGLVIFDLLFFGAYYLFLTTDRPGGTA